MMISEWYYPSTPPPRSYAQSTHNGNVRAEGAKASVGGMGDFCDDAKTVKWRGNGEGKGG